MAATCNQCCPFPAPMPDSAPTSKETFLAACTLGSSNPPCCRYAPTAKGNSWRILALCCARVPLCQARVPPETAAGLRQFEATPQPLAPNLVYSRSHLARMVDRYGERRQPISGIGPFWAAVMYRQAKNAGQCYIAPSGSRPSITLPNCWPPKSIIKPSLWAMAWASRWNRCMGSESNSA